MKTKTLFFAVLFTVSTMALAFANDAPGMTVVSVKGSEVFKVIYKGERAGKVKLKVFDSQGHIILSEIITGLDGFIYPLNFKGLPSGPYAIEVIDDDGTQRKEVFYQPSYKKKSIHISKLRDEGKFLLTIANSQIDNIYVKIYDADKTLIHSESKVITGDLAQVYKILNLSSSYTFEVSDTWGNTRYFTF